MSWETNSDLYRSLPQNFDWLEIICYAIVFSLIKGVFLISNDTKIALLRKVIV